MSAVRPEQDIAAADEAAAVAEWSLFLDALERTAAALQAAPEPDLPVVDDPGRPTTPLPAALASRRDRVGRALDDATADLQRRQAAVAAELAALRPRTARSAYRDDTGSALDVSG